MAVVGGVWCISEESKLKKTWIVIVTVVAFILIGGTLVGPIMSDVEQPDYEIIALEQNIEIRRYSPMIIAEVEVEGERKDAISNGFRMLADYIFGNNTVQQDIAMTAPVQQQANKKISMTAPVQQQSSGEAWKVSFVMPAEYSLEVLPKPNNEDIKLKEIPEKQFIAIQFSGTNSSNNIARHEALLMQHIEESKIKTVGSLKYAFYNPPWTLPFMRRNEIMIEIDDKE